METITQTSLFDDITVSFYSAIEDRVVVRHVKAADQSTLNSIKVRYIYDLFNAYMELSKKELEGLKFSGAHSTLTEVKKNIEKAEPSIIEIFYNFQGLTPYELTRRIYYSFVIGDLNVLLNYRHASRSYFLRKQRILQSIENEVFINFKSIEFSIFSTA